MRSHTQALGYTLWFSLLSLKLNIFPFSAFILTFSTQNHLILRVSGRSSPSRPGPKLKVDSAQFENKYFWTEIHKFLSFQNVFDRFELKKFKH